MGANGVEPIRYCGSCRSGDRRADGGWTVNTGACCRGETRVVSASSLLAFSRRRHSPNASSRRGKLTSGPLGVNLFVPQPSAGTPTEFTAYAAALSGEAERNAFGLGEPRFDDDDWAAKLDVVHDLRPEVCPSRLARPRWTQCSRLERRHYDGRDGDHRRRSRDGVGQGSNALVAQGPSAGGHRATFDPVARPADEPLPEPLAALVARVGTPIVAAVGSRHPRM